MKSPKLLTRSDVEKDVEKGWHPQGSSDWYFKGRGVNYRLFGPYADPTPEQLARMEEGTRRHKEIEDGVCENIKILDWIEEIGFPLQHEVFVKGNLFGIPTVGFLDGVGIDPADDKAIIIDWKFSRVKNPKGSPFTRKYEMVQTCYAKLLFEDYGIETKKFCLLFINPDTDEINPIWREKKDFFDLYQAAHTQYVNNESKNAWKKKSSQS